MMNIRVRVQASDSKSKKVNDFLGLNNLIQKCNTIPEMYFHT